MGYSKEPKALALCNARYGKELLTELKLRLVGGTQNKEPRKDHVVWHRIFARYGLNPDGRKVVTPTATKMAFNTHWRSILDGSRNWRSSIAIKTNDLYEHLLAGADEIERIVAYTNACPIVGRHRAGLFMLDIDCHDGQAISEAWTTAKHLDDVIGAPIYWEPSTSGSGLHGYVLLLWHRSIKGMNDTRIRLDIREFEGVLEEMTAGMPATCAEVKGAPMLFSADWNTLKKMGSWAKLPRPQSRDDAERLLDVLSHGVSCFDAIQLARSALSSSRKKTATQPISSPSAHHPREGQVEGQSSNCAHPLVLHQVESQSDDYSKALYRGDDTFARAKDFVPWFVRQQYRSNGRLPSVHQVQRAYEREGLSKGNSDERCVAEVYEYVARTFDPTLVGRRSMTGWLPHATDLVQAALRDNGERADLEVDYQGRIAAAQKRGRAESSIKSLRRLQPQRLSNLVACLLWVLSDAENQTDGFGQRVAATLMKKAFGLSLHQREFDAGMEWITRNGFCELVREAISTKSGNGRCRLYRLTISAAKIASQPA